MKRKVVRHGDSTLTISLPSKWAKANSIKPGQLLNLEQTDCGIFVSSNENYPIEKTEITLSWDKEWYIQRILRHLYTYGYDEVSVNYAKKEQLLLLRKGLESLPGFEIGESNPKICKIRCVGSLESTEYDDTVKKILWLILSQFDYLIEDCGVKNPIMHDEVNELFKTISKLINLCRRLINKRPPYDSTISKYAYRFLTSLMNIASFLIYTYDYSKKMNKLQLSQSEMELVTKTRGFYYQLLMAYQNLNVEKTKQFFSEREEMFDVVLELFREKNPVITHYFLDILKELSSIGNLVLILRLSEENAIKNKWKTAE